MYSLGHHLFCITEKPQKCTLGEGVKSPSKLFQNILNDGDFLVKINVLHIFEVHYSLGGGRRLRKVIFNMPEATIHWWKKGWPSLILSGIKRFFNPWPPRCSTWFASKRFDKRTSCSPAKSLVISPILPNLKLSLVFSQVNEYFPWYVHINLFVFYTLAQVYTLYVYAETCNILGYPWSLCGTLQNVDRTDALSKPTYCKACGWPQKMSVFPVYPSFW